MTTITAPEDTLLTVRATVNLAGLSAGHTATVDPHSPYIAECLRAHYLVPIDEEEPDVHGS